MKRRYLAVLTLVLSLALVASACSKGSTTGGSPSSSTGETSSEEGGGTITLGGQTANDHGTKDVSGGGKLDVEVDDFYFSPTVFTGKAGEKLTLTLTNDSTTRHNFSLPDQSINKDIAPGATVTVTVTFPDSGTAVFFCEYHHSKGMVGGLTVG